MSKSGEVPEVSALAVEIRVLLGQLKRRMREESEVGDFTTSQLAVLSRLEREGPATVTALARGEGVRPQSIGPAIAGLEALGFIVGQPHPTDGRQTIYSLTAEAVEFFQAGRAAREDWLSRSIRTHYTPAEQRELDAAVQLLKRLIAP